MNCRAIFTSPSGTVPPTEDGDNHKFRLGQWKGKSWQSFNPVNPGSDSGDKSCLQKTGHKFLHQAKKTMEDGAWATIKPEPYRNQLTNSQTHKLFKLIYMGGKRP